MPGKLHPRKQGNPGTVGALAPAIVLTSISAFEGFVEEFVARRAAHRSQSYGQIAKLVSMNNPAVKTFEKELRQLRSWGDGTSRKAAFSVNVWKPPQVEDSPRIRNRRWTELMRNSTPRGGCKFDIV